MTIPLEFVTNQLTAQDDPKLWGEVLMVLGDEFLQRFRGEGDDKKVWYVRVGACSHWLGPHRVRWTVAGGFAAPVGYGGAGAFSFGLPEFDWSVILTFDGGRWNQVDKFSGKKQIVLRIAIPTRTAHHKQAAIHAVWSTSHKHKAYGFRNANGEWKCIAVSDERKNGRILTAKVPVAQQ